MGVLHISQITDAIKLAGSRTILSWMIFGRLYGSVSGNDTGSDVEAIREVLARDTALDSEGSKEEELFVV
jgi:hypothetical protein